MSAAIQHRPHTSEMTFWSRHDPVRMPRGNTDNWAKLRVRSNTFRADNSLDGITFTSDAEATSSKPAATAAGAADAAVVSSPWSGRFQLTPQGTVRRMPDPSFTQLLSAQLRGQLPGSLGPPQPSSHLRKYWLDNPFQQRARQNFRYWLVEKPASTKYGKYGFGSFKTVLGVGNAPRT